jgi:hypothetical protein
LLEYDQIGMSLTCDFKNQHLCSWSNDKLRAQVDFIFNKPEDSGQTEAQTYFKKFDASFKTGPQQGDKNSNTSKRLLRNRNASTLDNKNIDLTELNLFFSFQTDIIYT